MNFHDSIALRPQFQLYSDASKDKILKQFSNQDDHNTIRRSCVVAPHVFLKITKREQHFWSPQLHLEIFDSDKRIQNSWDFWTKSETLDFLYVFALFSSGSFY